MITYTYLHSCGHPGILHHSPTYAVEPLLTKVGRGSKGELIFLISVNLNATWYQKGVGFAPPFFLVWTDNGLEFTMRFAYRSERITAFQRTILELDLLHGTCKPHSPWQNGIIERSHPTDNAELFHGFDSQARKSDAIC